MHDASTGSATTLNDGPAKVIALFERAVIASSRRASGLGDRQRQALADTLT